MARGTLLVWVLVGAVCLVSGGCKDSGGSKPSKRNGRAPRRADAASVPRAPTLEERLAATDSLVEAIRILRPFMSNSFNDFSAAAVTLARWWMDKGIRFEDMAALPKTTYRKVMKDPMAERGKKICVRARIVEIHAHHDLPTTYFTGGLVRGYSQVYRYIALGSSGDLVARNVARFCGVVMGVQSYRNVSGGTTHSVELVGMFNLKENRRFTQ